MQRSEDFFTFNKLITSNLTDSSLSIYVTDNVFDDVMIYVFGSLCI